MERRLGIRIESMSRGKLRTASERFSNCVQGMFFTPGQVAAWRVCEQYFGAKIHVQDVGQQCCTFATGAVAGTFCAALPTKIFRRERLLNDELCVRTDASCSSEMAAWRTVARRMSSGCSCWPIPLVMCVHRTPHGLSQPRRSQKPPLMCCSACAPASVIALARNNNVRRQVHGCDADCSVNF